MFVPHRKWTPPPAPTNPRLHVSAVFSLHFHFHFDKLRFSCCIYLCKNTGTCSDYHYLPTGLQKRMSSSLYLRSMQDICGAEEEGPLPKWLLQMLSQDEREGLLRLSIFPLAITMEMATCVLPSTCNSSTCCLLLLLLMLFRLTLMSLLMLLCADAAAADAAAACFCSDLP